MFELLKSFLRHAQKQRRIYNDLSNLRKWQDESQHRRVYESQILNLNWARLLSDRGNMLTQSQQRSPQYEVGIFLIKMLSHNAKYLSPNSHIGNLDQINHQLISSKVMTKNKYILTA